MREIVSIIENDQYQVADYSKVCNTGVVGLASRLLHRTIESFGWVSRRNYLLGRSDLLIILEVGAGGQHAKYVRHPFDQLMQCDIRPKNIPNGGGEPQIVKDFDPVDAQSLPYAHNSIDRLIAT